MSSGSIGNRFGFGYGTVPIPNPRPIQQPGTIPEPLMINAPNPIPEPFVIPSSTILDFTFEDMNLIGWSVIDEPPHLLNDVGPSKWGIADGPISGKALTQTSNIWGDKADAYPLGTFIIYNLQDFNDFIMDFDVLGRDNDAMGMVWGWRDRLQHFRFLTTIDPDNPTGAPPERKGPFSMMERRTGDAAPYYATLLMKKEAAYVANQVTHFRLEIINRNVRVLSNNNLVFERFSPGYNGGKIGFTLYAHSEIYFDNLRVETIIPQTVDQMSRFFSNTGTILPR